MANNATNITIGRNDKNKEGDLWEYGISDINIGYGAQI